MMLKIRERKRGKKSALSIYHIRAKKKLWNRVPIKPVSRVEEGGVNHIYLVVTAINKAQLLMCMPGELFMTHIFL